MWLFVHSGQIIRNLLPLVKKESLEDRSSSRGESCLKKMIGQLWKDSLSLFR